MKKYNLIKGKIYKDNYGNNWEYKLYNVLEQEHICAYASEDTYLNNVDLIKYDFYIFDDELNFVGEEDTMWLIPISLTDKLNLL